MRERAIRASEIGQYVYCPRAWWLGQVRGLAPANIEELALGEDFHADHGRAMASVLYLRRWTLILLGLSAACLTLALLLGRGQ